MTDLLNMIPQPVRMTLAALLLGILAVAGADQRYMTVDTYMKGYILDLKEAIRELRRQLDRAETETERQSIQRDIDELIDELCYEKPDDSYC